MSLTIHSKYKYFDSTVQRAENRRQKFHFCRLSFAVNVMLNLSNVSSFARALKVCLRYLSKVTIKPQAFLVPKLNSKVNYCGFYIGSVDVRTICNVRILK